MKKTIFLSRDIEVLIVSSGGVGTTLLINEIGRYKKTNSAANEDGYKHLPIPPISANPKLKVIYLFGDPVLACISLFRRSYQHTASVQMQKYLPDQYLLPPELKLETYGQTQRDGLFFERHFSNWHTTYPFYDRLFVRYETLFDHLAEIAGFLELPPAFIREFPSKKKRRSSREEVDPKTLDQLNELYGGLSEKLSALPDVFELPARPEAMSGMIYFRNPYRAAVGQACLRKMPLVRHGLNRITMEAKRVSSRIRTVLARVKRKLLKKPFLKDRRFPPYWINKQLGNKAAYLVQIGSNDGKTGDPFFPLLRMNKHWKALFVEPIPFFFEKLKQNYPDTERFRFENAGVNEGRTMEFYWLKPEIYEQFDDLPYWYEQLGSFDRGHIISQVKKDVLPFITSAPVAGIRLDDLLQRHQVQEIDILHIDAEGYDWKILAQLDLQRYRPDFILFEYHHLSPEEQAGAADFLKEYYELFQVGIDAFAVRRDIGAAFLQAMAKALSKKK